MDEQAIRIEEVDGVAAPPKARVEPTTSAPVEGVQRRVDYLAGFLNQLVVQTLRASPAAPFTTG